MWSQRTPGHWVRPDGLALVWTPRLYELDGGRWVMVRDGAVLAGEAGLPLWWSDLARAQAAAAAHEQREVPCLNTPDTSESPSWCEPLTV